VPERSRGSGLSKSCWMCADHASPTVEASVRCPRQARPDRTSSEAVLRPACVPEPWACLDRTRPFVLQTKVLRPSWPPQVDGNCCEEVGLRSLSPRTRNTRITPTIAAICASGPGRSTSRALHPGSLMHRNRARPGAYAPRGAFVSGARRNVPVSSCSQSPKGRRFDPAAACDRACRRARTQNRPRARRCNSRAEGPLYRAFRSRCEMG
jgi:hypothetical protein